MRYHGRSFRSGYRQRCVHLLPGEHCWRRDALPYGFEVLWTGVTQVLRALGQCWITEGRAGLTADREDPAAEEHRLTFTDHRSQSCCEGFRFAFECLIKWGFMHLSRIFDFRMSQEVEGFYRNIHLWLLLPFLIVVELDFMRKIRVFYFGNLVV